MSMVQGQPIFTSIASRFAVQDRVHALAFYTRLGFESTHTDEAFAIVALDGISIHLNASPEPSNRHAVCWIGVSNIEALYQQYLLTLPIGLRTSAIQGPLETKPWGLKEFCVCDPFRNLILFACRP